MYICVNKFNNTMSKIVNVLTGEALKAFTEKYNLVEFLEHDEEIQAIWIFNWLPTMNFQIDIVYEYIDDTENAWTYLIKTDRINGVISNLKYSLEYNDWYNTWLSAVIDAVIVALQYYNYEHEVENKINLK